MKLLLTVATGALLTAPAIAQSGQNPDKRAAATAAAMTDAERTVLTQGVLALPLIPGTVIPPKAVVGAGYVAGIPRLGVPPLTESDASLGVAWIGGLRNAEGATPLPSGLAQAASWNPDIVRRGGATIGAEAKAKGFNVLLAGGVNLVRDPRGGRSFEYLSEDPLLTGMIGGAAIAGVQSNNIISTIKHFALNDQETGRGYADVRIADAAARESDLLAFQIAIEQGRPGAVMCAYNKVNGAYSCGNDYLLNTVLKRDWKYKGFVMSDWGGVHALDYALNGLDQQSGAQLDEKVVFGDVLRQAAATDKAYAARLLDMNRRVLYAIYANGLDKHPPVKQPIDVDAGLAVAEAAAKQSIVLLRNERSALPLAAGAKRIVVIGGYADTGVLSGGGSSQVQMTGGPAGSVPLGGDGPFSAFFQESYQRSVPLKAITTRAKGAEVRFIRGDYIGEAVDAVHDADAVIVFATGWRMEGSDVPDLSLPHGQDALIAALSEANPNTIVVLETGGPVLMPWLAKTAAVVEAWYPGGRGGEAIASVLFGDTNPSGRLPITFPANLDQLPRPASLRGDATPSDFLARPVPGRNLTVNYDTEGSDVGYRWNARKGNKALFPFGYGMSYTSFTRSGLRMSRTDANLTVTNVGDRAGAEVVQLYLVGRPDGPKQRLVGFQRVELAAGQHRDISLAIDPRLLADWNGHGWTMQPGNYLFALGTDAERLATPVSIRLGGRSWK